MDLQFQQIFQRRPNRPPPQSAPIQAPSRPPNTQRPPQFPPPVPRQQSGSYRGNQQQNQFQNFDRNQGQGQGQGQRPYRQQQQQGSSDQYQGGNRGNFSQGMGRNQTSQNQYRNQNQYQGESQQSNFDQSAQRFRQPRQQQRQYQNREQQNQGQRQYQNNRQQSQSQPRRSSPYQQQPYNNRNQSREDYVPNQRDQRNTQKTYENVNSQDSMKNAMSQFFQQNFQQGQPRGRGRGRGNRGRPNNYERGQNQHQRPFKSEMDNNQNKERLQKFKPKPSTQRQAPKNTFVKKDEESVSREASIQSQRSYSEEDRSSNQSRSQSGSYSEYSDERSRSQQRDAISGQEGQQSQQQQRSQSPQSQAESEEQMDNVIIPGKLPSSKSIQDISTNAINDMCSKQEYNERLETFQQNNRDAQHSKLRLDTSRSFSIFEINRRTCKPDYALALKRFKRSAQRAEGENDDDTKDCRRSVKALVKVINHINKEIIDADNMRTKDLAFPLPPGEQAFQFIHVYDFLWDRMREMIKDITRLPLKQKLSKEIITICQQIARFFILSINEGRKKYNSKLKFDERMNIQSIIKVISNLMELYRQSRMNLKSLIQGLPQSEKESLTIEKVQALMQLHGIYLSPHEPELSAYSFLFSDDRKKELYQILTVGFEDQQTQSDSPLINSQQMQRALAVHRILNERNIEKYFEKIEQNDTDYVFSCMMLKHLHTIRKETSKMLFKSHYYKDSHTESKSAILAETLRQTLRFPQSQSQEFVEFLDMLGVRNQGKLLIWRDGSLNEDHYIIPEYIFQKDKTQRKHWSDTECKKNIIHQKYLSRQQMVKCSWKKTTYREEIINFFLGKALAVKQIKPKVTLLKQIPTKEVSKQSIELPRDKQGDEAAIQKEKEAKNLSALNEMRKGLQKKAKRTKFLEKIQSEIHELFRHTDQAKIINRKKALAIVDEWMMYYHDKMLRISLNMIQNQSRKKNLLVSMLRQVKTFSGIKKQFHDSFNKLPYEFEAVNQKNLRPQKSQKGLMSGLLAKAQFKAKKISYDSFEDYLNSTENSFSNKSINFMILTTCSSSSQNQKILYDTILYFMHQEKGNFSFKKKQIIDAINKNRTKEKEVPLLKVYFEAQNLVLNLRLAKINEAKSKRKAMTQNSHVIQHLFGCHGLILMRDNSKHHATQVILQNLEQFVHNKSRIYQGEGQSEEKQKIQTLQKIQLPILLINAIRKPSASESSKTINLSKINKQKYPYLTNLNEAIVVEGTTDPYNLPYMLRQHIQKQLKNTQKYMMTMNCINIMTHRFDSSFDNSLVLQQAMHQPIEAKLQIKSLKQLLRQIRVNSSVIEEKLGFKQGDISSQIKKKFIFSFYQEYFNLCLAQIIEEASNCYKNSIYFKKWTKNLLLAQNMLTEKDFIKTDLNEGLPTKLSEGEQQDLISNTLQNEPEYNLISQTFKEYEFIVNICQQLKMKFVGENIEPIQTKYLIFDEEGVNVFGMPKQSLKDQTPLKQKERILHLTHFINTIGKYISLFDQNKTLTDDKFQNLYTVFQEYQLDFKLFNLNELDRNGEMNEKNTELKINYQIEGDSLEFFSYLIGYLMDGCKHVNVLLPANFRFRVNTEHFMRQSMKNLSNVIKLTRHTKKDIFQNLKHEKNPSLSRLVIDDHSHTQQNSQQLFQKVKITKPHDKIPYQHSPFIMMQEQNMQKNVIDVDKEQEQTNHYKRQIDYHYRTVYPQVSHNEYRRQMLNELKKKVKTELFAGC